MTVSNSFASLSALTRLGRRQIKDTEGLVNNIRMNQHTLYIEKRFQEIQTKCLQLWGIPTKVREKPKYAKATTAKIRGIKLLTPYPHGKLRNAMSKLTCLLFTKTSTSYSEFLQISSAKPKVKAKLHYSRVILPPS